ncbi:MAG TPA: AI-2E family transporter [Actinomycetota bacterium]|nr:AI-2E family transporter [Actinomycetota bacterium]
MERQPASAVPRWLEAGAAYAWRLIVLAIALWLAANVLARLKLVVVPLVVGVFIAALLLPLVDRLDARLPLPRTVWSLLVLVLALAALAGVFTLIVPRFVDQLDELQRSVQEGLRSVEGWLDERLGVSLAQVRDRFVGGIDGGAIGQQVLSGAVLVAELLAGLLLAIVLCFFIVRDGPAFARAAVRWLPEGRRDVGAAIGRRSWAVIGAYLRGVMITGVVDAVAIGIGLWAIGVPLVFSLMTLTFFGAFFPLVGAFLAGTVAVLVALVSGGATDALLTLAVVVAVQQLEGDVVAPLVIGRTLSLHPVVIVLSLTAGAIVAGIVGAAFAVPLAAVIRAAVDEVRSRRRDDARASTAVPEPPGG